MRNSAFLACLLVFVCAVGCTPTRNGNNPPTDPEWARVILEHETNITTGVTIGTTVIVNSFKETESRELAGAYAYDAARAIFEASKDEKMELNELRDLISEKIDNSDMKFKAEVGILLQAAKDIVESRVNLYFADADPNVRIVAIRRFIRAASEGVMRATEQYATFEGDPFKE